MGLTSRKPGVRALRWQRLAKDRMEIAAAVDDAGNPAALRPDDDDDGGSLT